MLAATTTTDGTTSRAPNAIPVNWYRYWLEQDPDFDWQTITYEQFVEYFHQSVSQFDHAWSTDDPDLSASS